MVKAERQRNRGMVPPAPAEQADSRLTNIADWLRNEKKSGLITKEAIQYDRVRAALRQRG